MSCHSLIHQRRRRRLGTDRGSGFCYTLQHSPPPIPPALLRRLGANDVPGVGKVKVMLRVSGKVEESQCLKVDRRHKQVTLSDPSSQGPQHKRVAVAAPKMFAFDGIFTDEENPINLNSTALAEVLNAVINGSDGCLLGFEHAKLGKTRTMLGSPEGPLGVIPCAISWLFRGINEQKLRTGSRFSIRVSAIEISNGMKDLLIGHANDCEQSPAVYLREGGQNFSGLRAPSAEKAAYYLDCALCERSAHAHFLYTLHVYQYSLGSKGAVAGGRSRLHLLDLGAPDRNSGMSGLGLSGIGNVLLAIFNGQRHPPHRENSMTQILKECLSSLTCYVTILTHVSSASVNYSETLSTVQLAARIHRIRRRRVKFGNSAATQVAGEDIGRLTGSSDVDPSSSEQSADTVIYVGRSEETDGEHPPVYLSNLTSGDDRCAMGKALRGSSVEARLLSAQFVSRSMPSSPQRVPGENQDKAKSSMYGKNLATNSAKSSPIKTNSINEFKFNDPNQLEEKWIDGPKIPKSKVVEARHLNLLHKSRQHSMSKKETWVDGPLKSNNDENIGFMDYHKKSMIKKWIENQSLILHRHKSAYGREKNSRGYVPRFKSSVMERRTEGEGKSKSSSSGSRDENYKNVRSLMDLKDEAYERFKASRGQASGQEDEDCEEEVKVVPPLAQTTTVSQNGELSKVVPVQRLQETVENPDNYEDEVEIVEVEESEVSVPMQDSCLQVTEEDIALCMGEDENPLPEVDQSEQALRFLEQRNASFLSTFTDSFSVAFDFERLMAQGQNNRNRAPLLATKGLMDFGTLPLTDPMENRPLARCQSLSLTDVLEPLSDVDNNSINSEPAYILGGDALSDKLCDKCRMRFNSGDLYEPSFYTNLRSLRHPDGASNPNLKHAGAAEKENVTPRRGEEDSDEDPAVPPPLHSNLFTLTRDTFKRKKGVMLESSEGSCSQSQFNVHDPGGTGMQYCKEDVERLERLRGGPLSNCRWQPPEREPTRTSTLVRLRDISPPRQSTSSSLQSNKNR